MAQLSLLSLLLILSHPHTGPALPLLLMFVLQLMDARRYFFEEAGNRCAERMQAEGCQEQIYHLPYKKKMSGASYECTA